MNQPLFKPRILLLATALAAGAVGAQSTNTTPSATTTPGMSSRTSYPASGAARDSCIDRAVDAHPQSEACSLGGLNRASS